MEVSDKNLIKIYNKGFENTEDNDNNLIKLETIYEYNAYNLGKEHGKKCETVKNTIFLSEEKLLKMIKEI